ncbi:hypothetical protein ACOPJQ_08570 [Luteimonas dalianensis]|uniref:hypothetical protein n=1 Tax=Luteimonas dalianensis TaxID=1148196 RepID=UPI003BF42926
MEFNPFYARIRTLEAQMRTLESQRSQIQDDLESHDAESVEAVTKAIAAGTKRAEDLQVEAAKIERSIEEMRDRSLLSAETIQPWGLSKSSGWAAPVAAVALGVPGLGAAALTGWMLLARRKAKEEGKRHVDMQEAAREQLLTRAKEELAKVAKLRSANAMLISFDAESARRALAIVDQDLQRLQTEVAVLERKKAELDRQLGSIPEEIADTRQAIERLKREQEQLKRLSLELKELKGPQNGAKRAAIHFRCRSILGFSDHKEDYESDKAFKDASDPGRNAQHKVAEVNRLSRDLEKLLERAYEIKQHAETPVESLFIDGSNLCSENGVFVGVGPVVAVARWMVKHRPDCAVHVFFDKKSLGKLTGHESEKRGQKIRHLSEADLKRVFAGLASLNVVDGRADKVILASAAEAGGYVVSNDRFAEFSSQPPVSDGRVFSHNIVAGTVMIPSLELVARYDKDLMLSEAP